MNSSPSDPNDRPPAHQSKPTGPHQPKPVDTNQSTTVPTTAGEMAAADIVQRIERERAEPAAAATLEEEGKLFRALVEFIRDERGCCPSMALVPITRRVEPGGSVLKLSRVSLIVQRYRCLVCGHVSNAAVERTGHE